MARQGEVPMTARQGVVRGSRAFAAMVIVATLLSHQGAARSATSQGPRERDQFASVNGIRLHYVDWGGTGTPMLFLGGGGNGGAHTFDSFAPRFTDHFEVLGLTRRGGGLSDKPPSSYDTNTLATDIAGFLDALHISRAILVGYSLAGAEMTRFAGTYPNRVRALVYLDAVVDYVRIAEISAEAGFNGQGFDETPQVKAIQAGAAQSHPDYTKVTAPALAFIETCGAPPQARPEDDPAYKRYLQLLYEKGVWWESIKQFRAEMKHGTIIELPDCNHFFFKDPQQAERAEREMRTFLSRP